MPAPEPKGRSPWRDIGLVLNLGFFFAAAVAVGAFLGTWLDARLGTSPLFTVVLLVLGFVAGLLELFRELKSLNRE